MKKFVSNGHDVGKIMTKSILGDPGIGQKNFLANQQAGFQTLLELVR